MQSSWNQNDVFPVIARIIEQASREKAGFITTPEIAERLLQDVEGQNLVGVALEQRKDKQSPAWLAVNMVAWFSQRVTIGESNWAEAFDRTKINGRWAYRNVNNKLTSGGQSPGHI